MISRYISSWGIIDRSSITPENFQILRNKLILLNLLLVCQQFYLKTRKLTELPYSALQQLLNYFIVEFIPHFLMNDDVKGWICEYKGQVLLDKQKVFQQTKNFLKWWRKVDKCFEVFPHPGFDPSKLSIPEVVNVPQLVADGKTTDKREEQSRIIPRGKLEKKKHIRKERTQ